jgi:hypothetical protein
MLEQSTENLFTLDLIEWSSFFRVFSVLPKRNSKAALVCPGV